VIADAFAHDSAIGEKVRSWLETVMHQAFSREELIRRGMNVGKFRRRTGRSIVHI
jgi:hypothetical protein